jgi:hypothetical protein
MADEAGHAVRGDSFGVGVLRWNDVLEGTINQRKNGRGTHFFKVTVWRAFPACFAPKVASVNDFSLSALRSHLLHFLGSYA